VDGFACWPQVITFLDIPAGTVTHTQLSGWISRFGCPDTITTDQGSRFDSQLFNKLAKLYGINLFGMSLNHPAASSIVQQLHCTLRASVICHSMNLGPRLSR
jgi:hypothetical protein